MFFFRTCIVATAFRTRIIIIGETARTTIKVAIPIASLFADSFKVSFTYNLQKNI